MKKITLALFYLFLFYTDANAQSADSLYVNGRFLYNHCNQKIILRGVNYSVLDDWDFPANMNNGNERSREIEKSGSNCVRIQWYNNYGQPARPAYNLVHLDSLLTRCKRYNIIPILGLWDMTCSNDWANFTSTITNWWLQPAVLALIEKHKRYMILNIANEFGYYQWTGNPSAAFTTFKTNYKAAITSLRNAGVRVPLMIDAPDCGQNLDVFILGGQELVTHDPLHNILLGTHAYWTGYVGNDSTTMANKLQQAVAANLPLVMGEIANYQSDAQPCQYLLNYPDLLESLKIKEIGWLGWTWYKDYCSSREMTATGLYSQLNTYGSDLVNNSVYGLKTTALRSAETFTTCTSILPLHLLELQLQNSNGLPLLHINYSGNDLVKMVIEKSIDQLHWTQLHSIAIQGQTGKNQFTDHQTSNGNTYYRVVIADKEGHQFYSEIRVFHQLLPAISIWPNPASDKVFVKASHIVLVKIYDQQGRCLQTIKGNSQNNISIPLNRFTAGIYTIECTTQNNASSKKQLLIQHNN